MIEKRKRTYASRKRHSDNAKRLGEYLQGLRKSARVKTTLEDAAEEFGISRNTLHAIEKGKALPDMRVLAAASRFYGADFRELLSLRAAAEDDPDLNAQVDKLKVVDIFRVLDPRDDLSAVLDIKHLSAVVLAVEMAERNWRGVRMKPGLKARLIAGMYGVGAHEGRFTDLGVGLMLGWIRASCPNELEARD